ncbi:MAG: hypothetical protein J1E38_09555 [Paramuribaculum sp.]|nr:hypothetical protein [Paramuribaculum sp.]
MNPADTLCGWWFAGHRRGCRQYPVIIKESCGFGRGRMRDGGKRWWVSPARGIGWGMSLGDAKRGGSAVGCGTAPPCEWLGSACPPAHAAGG